AVLGPLVRRFVRESDAGHEDAMRATVERVESVGAAYRIEQKKIIDKYLQDDRDRPTMSMKAFNDAKSKGHIEPGYSYLLFKRRYETAWTYRHGTPEEKAKERLSKTEQKAAGI